VVPFLPLCWGGGGVVFVGLLSLTSSVYPSPYSPYSWELFFSAGGWSAPRVFLCVRVRRFGAFGFTWERTSV